MYASTTGDFFPERLNTVIVTVVKFIALKEHQKTTCFLSDCALQDKKFCRSREAEPKFSAALSHIPS